MKQCPNCGTSFSDSHLFCSECGASLADAPPSPAPAPDSPTVQIPAVQPPPSAPAADPPPAAPAKKSRAPVVAIALLAVFAILAAACAGFAGYKALQFKKDYEQGQSQLRAAQEESSDIQAKLDKLQLDYDKMSDELDDSTSQLEDARSQLADVSGQLSDGSSQLDELRDELDNLVDLLDYGYGFASRNYFASKGVVVLRQYGSETVSIYEDYAGSNTYTYHTPNSGVSCSWNGAFTNGTTTITITGNAPGYYPVSFTNDLNSESFEILVIVTE